MAVEGRRLAEGDPVNEERVGVAQALVRAIGVDLVVEDVRASGLAAVRRLGRDGGHAAGIDLPHDEGVGQDAGIAQLPVAAAVHDLLVQQHEAILVHAEQLHDGVGQALGRPGLLRGADHAAGEAGARRDADAVGHLGAGPAGRRGLHGARRPEGVRVVDLVARAPDGQPEDHGIVRVGGRVEEAATQAELGAPVGLLLLVARAVAGRVPVLVEEIDVAPAAAAVALLRVGRPAAVDGDAQVAGAGQRGRARVEVHVDRGEAVLAAAAGQVDHADVEVVARGLHEDAGRLERVDGHAARAAVLGGVAAAVHLGHGLAEGNHDVARLGAVEGVGGAADGLAVVSAGQVTRAAVQRPLRDETRLPREHGAAVRLDVAARAGHAPETDEIQLALHGGAGRRVRAEHELRGPGDQGPLHGGGAIQLAIDVEVHGAGRGVVAQGDMDPTAVGHDRLAVLGAALAAAGREAQAAVADREPPGLLPVAAGDRAAAAARSALDPGLDRDGVARPEVGVGGHAQRVVLALDDEGALDRTGGVGLVDGVRFGRPRLQAGSEAQQDEQDREDRGHADRVGKTVHRRVPLPRSAHSTTDSVIPASWPVSDCLRRVADCVGREPPGSQATDYHIPRRGATRPPESSRARSAHWAGRPRAPWAQAPARASISAASAKSFSVIPPASWVTRSTTTTR